jgi:predicted ATP-grasp superfamily ATP-dependent carboligase
MAPVRPHTQTIECPARQAGPTKDLFVHEYFSSGAYAGELRESSLAPEGLAMLAAILEDFTTCSAGRVVTTLDRRLTDDADEMRLDSWAEIHWAESPEHERVLFQKLAAQCTGTFVIAPETDGLLLDRREQVEATGGRFVGHSAGAIKLCSDKFAFFEHLVRHDLPTIQTKLFDRTAAASTFQFPIVIKPLDGAGSQDTYLISNEREFADLHETLGATFRREGQAIVQPYLAGLTLSIGAIADGPLGGVHVFPTGQQHLSDDGRFHYRGGTIPACLRKAVDASKLVTRICRSIEGLSGYIGLDLLLPVDSQRLLVVEANPRLTTSYLGYRALAKENLAARILHPERANAPIAWHSGRVDFTADGRIRSSADQ